MQTPDSYRSAHGDITTWSTADIEGYEHTVEAVTPAYAEAIASGRYVIGRHAQGDQVVVDFAAPEDMAHRRTSTGHGKNSHAAVLAQTQRLAS